VRANPKNLIALVGVLDLSLMAGFVRSETQQTLRVGFLVVDGVYNSELIAPYDIFHP
jgi:hypothetical protein